MSKYILASIFILISFAVVISKSITPSSINYLQQMEQCFLDGQIPCRWLIDENNGMGFPTFNKISSLPYYTSIFFRLFGFDYTISLTLTYIIITLICFYTLYKYLLSYFSLTKSVLISLFVTIASLYLIHIFTATAFVLFLFFLKQNRYLSSLAFTLILLSLSKPLIIPAIIIVPIFALLITKNLKYIFPILALGLILSAFYTGPAFYYDNFKIHQNSQLNYLSEPQALTGISTLSEFRQRSNFWRLTANVISSEDSEVIIPISYHPSWTILIDQSIITPLNDTMYTPIRIIIPPGQHTVVSFLENMPLIKYFNFLTIISLLYLFVVSFPYDGKKNHQ